MLAAISIEHTTPYYHDSVASSYWHRERSAVSREAEVVDDVTSAATEVFYRSQALYGPKAEAISQLNLLAGECCTEDWDGNGAHPTDHLALLLAEEFIRVLPDDIPLPEFAPEPDGSISLDWIRSKSRVFSVSVGAVSRLAYAWIDGTDRGHAVAAFYGRGIPSRILEGIKAIVA